jgi:hypothetical protein
MKYWSFFHYEKNVRCKKVLSLLEPEGQGRALSWEVLKNAFKKIWTKDSNLTIKEKPNVVIKKLNFEIMVVVSRLILLEKKI